MIGQVWERAARRAIIVFASTMALVAIPAAGVQLGDVQVTLHSHKYYRAWDMTRLVYRVKSSSEPSQGASWILGVGECLTDEAIVPWVTTPFTRVDEPIPGMRFERPKRNEHFYVWLIGQWDVGTIPVAMVTGGGPSGGHGHHHGGEDKVVVGEIDGPRCNGTSISLETISGETVTFPSLYGEGRYVASSETILKVMSTSAGWGLGHDITVSAPDGASEATAEAALQVSYDPFQTLAGTTHVEVGYVLEVDEEDFAGLPEGTYVIRITYTVAAD